MDQKLREEDVARLLANPSADTRAEIAVKIAGQHPALSSAQRKLAEDIFRLMVKDAEVRVREALSRQLKENPLVPHDVALTLARDVDAVALPMLQFSEVLTDEDLIEIVRAQSPEKQVAVASRAHVSSGVAEALVDSHNETVVATLVSNEGAELTEATLQRVVDEFGASEAVGKPLVERASLPVTVAERLMAKVSENLRVALAARQDLSPETVANLLLQARELAVLGLADSDTDVAKLVDHLYRNNRLTPSIILRAVCMGDTTFFETALAKLARLLPAVVVVEDGTPEAGQIQVSAADIAAYQVNAARSLRVVSQARVPLASAENARIVAFRPADGGVEHLAIVIGEPDLDQPVLARLHSECFTGDLLGSLRCDCGDQLKGAIAEIAQAGSGVLLYLAQEGRGIGLVNKLRAYRLQDDGFDTLDANLQLGFDDDERIYQPAAQMLRLLGIGAVRLLTNNPAKVGQLAAHGIQVAERVPHVFPANDHNRSYLSTKATRSGHLF